LPLLHQRYMHYLYTPSAGLAMAIGAGAEWLLVRAAVPRARRAPVIAARGWELRPVLAVALVAGAIAAYVAASDALLVERAAGRIESVGLPSDPFVRKMETLRRTITATRAAVAGRHLDAVFVVPETGWSRRLAAVFHSILGDGRALLVTVPGLDSVAFVP